MSGHSSDMDTASRASWKGQGYFHLLSDMYI